MNSPSRGKKSGKRSHEQAGYLKLIVRFPLRPIRSHRDLDRATVVIHELLDRDHLNRAEQDYLDVLSGLVEIFEEEHFPSPEVESDAEAIRLLIDAKGITQQELARSTGIANSTISAVLHGTRDLNRDHIEVLSEFFCVEPSLFMAGKSRQRAARA